MTRFGTPEPDDQVAAALRSALNAEAESITPNDRWLAIQVATSTTPASARRSAGLRPWMMPLAASFLIFVLGFGVVLASRGPGTNQVAAPVPTVSTGATTASTDPTTATKAWDVPVYFVTTGDAIHPWVLQRDFVPSELTRDTVSDRVATAVSIVVSGGTAGGLRLPTDNGYQFPWRPGTLAEAQVTASEIRLVLSQPGVDGLTEEQQRIAVQSLVWTATAAAQRTMPVHVSSRGDLAVFPSRPVGTYQRPAPTAAYGDLAPIWITEPNRWTPKSASDPVILLGQACTFEAGVQWELSTAAGQPVKKGFTTAASACPDRSEWRVALGVLPAGDYRIRAYDVSPEDGKGMVGEVTIPFQVR